MEVEEFKPPEEQELRVVTEVVREVVLSPEVEEDIVLLDFLLAVPSQVPHELEEMELQIILVVLLNIMPIEVVVEVAIAVAAEERRPEVEVRVEVVLLDLVIDKTLLLAEAEVVVHDIVVVLSLLIEPEEYLY